MVDLGISDETAGGILICTAGEPGTPPNGDLYLFEIPEIGCLVAADERFHLEFDWGLLLIVMVMIQ